MKCRRIFLALLCMLLLTSCAQESTPHALFQLDHKEVAYLELSSKITAQVLTISEEQDISTIIDLLNGFEYRESRKANDPEYLTWTLSIFGKNDETLATLYFGNPSSVTVDGMNYDADSAYFTELLNMFPNGTFPLFR